MELSELDGFLTGIAVGPQIVMPSEWLPLVWGDEDPVFEDAAEAEAVLGTIMARFNNPDHPEHDATTTWYGGPFDPADIDIERANSRLAAIARRRQRGKGPGRA